MYFSFLEMKHLAPLGSVLEALNYSYDATGNRTSMNRQSVTLPLRNEVSNTNYNEANQMLRYNASSDNISYDENGNLTSITNGCGTTTLTWDVRNRLVGISGFNTDCSSLTASFKYDALGRRIEKTINGKTTQYLYDGLDIVQEIEDGAVAVNYIRTLNIDEPLARIKAEGTVRYYQTDALGSVIGLTDDTGAVKTQYSYDPFGGVTISGEANDNPFQYTGRENDNTGLYYYRARYYSPELQRFVSEDPIRFESGDVNFFRYVFNRPTMFTDPEGECLLAAAVIVSAAVPGLIVYIFYDCFTTCCKNNQCDDPLNPNSKANYNNCLQTCIPFLKFLGFNTPKGAILKGGSSAGQAIGGAGGGAGGGACCGAGAGTGGKK